MEQWKEEGLAVVFVKQKSPISFINYLLILVLEKASVLKLRVTNVSILITFFLFLFFPPEFTCRRTQAHPQLYLCMTIASGRY